MPNEMMMDPNSAVREGEMGKMGGMPMDPNSAVRESEMGMVQNADLKLVMTFLQNIRPGDMSPEAAEQLMNIGQRIQGGGSLSDNEREMFTSVVGETARFPVEQMATFPQGTNPDIMKAPPQGMGAMSDREMGYTVDGQTQNMTRKQYQDMVNSGQITQNPNLMGPR